MYYLLNGFLYLISLLPLRVLFLLSDFLYVIVYYIIGYRKDVVLFNLNTAFPEKSLKEKTSIMKQVYRNFTDFLVETIKLMSASDRWVNRHFECDYTLLNELNRRGIKCQVHLGHNFSWEIALHHVSMHVEQTKLCVYTPISSKPLDRLFRKLRTKRGSVLLPANKMRTAILPYRNHPYLLMLVADQSPSSPDKARWVSFFGKPTAFIKGPENGARGSGLAVLFCFIERSRRGHYHAELHLETEKPTELPEGELTRRYVRFLEDKMRQQPGNWLWTHKRWKLSYKEEYGEVLS